MDLGPHQRSYLSTGKPKRRDSLGRVFILTILILAGLYVISHLWRQDWVNPFVPTPTPTRTAASYFDEAKVLYHEGRLDEALVACRKAHQREPESRVVLSRLVRLMAFRNQAAQAVEQYGATLQAFDTAQTYAALCLAYDWNGQYEEALDACVRAVGDNPEYADAHAYLSEVYSNLGNWDAAYDEATKAVELDELSVEAHRAMAYALEVRGDYEGAAEGYLRAIELHPRFSYLYTSLALNYLALGEYDLAIEQFQKAIEIDPLAFLTSIPTPMPCKVTLPRNWPKAANWVSPGWTRPWNVIPTASPAGRGLTYVREWASSVGWTTWVKSDIIGPC